MTLGQIVILELRKKNINIREIKIIILIGLFFSNKGLEKNWATTSNIKFHLLHLGEETKQSTLYKSLKKLETLKYIKIEWKKYSFFKPPCGIAFFKK